MTIPGTTPRATPGLSSARAAGGSARAAFARRVAQFVAFARQPTLAFGALRIVVICLAAWGVYAHERSQAGGEAERSAADLLKTAERAAEWNLADLERTLDRLANRAVGQGSAIDFGALTAGGVALPAAAALGAFDASGGAPTGAAIALTDADRQALLDGARAQGAGPIVVASASHVALARAIADRQGRTAGFVVAVVDPATLIADAADLEASQAGLALVDREGRVIAGAGALSRASGERLDLSDRLRGADESQPADLGGGRRGLVANVAEKRTR